MNDDTLSLQEFCRLVGAQFTDDEVATLLALRSGDTDLHGPDDWQLFREPLRLVIGSADSEAFRIFRRSEIRSQYAMVVDVFLDERWMDKVDSFQDLVDAGVLEPRPVEPCWLVRTKTGRQFSTHKDEDDAKMWAERISGSYEWYIPVQAPLPRIGPFKKSGE